MSLGNQQMEGPVAASPPPPQRAFRSTPDLSDGINGTGPVKGPRCSRGRHDLGVIKRTGDVAASVSCAGLRVKMHVLVGAKACPDVAQTKPETLGAKREVKHVTRERNTSENGRAQVGPSVGRCEELAIDPHDNLTISRRFDLRSTSECSDNLHSSILHAFTCYAAAFTIEPEIGRYDGLEPRRQPPNEVRHEEVFCAVLVQEAGRLARHTLASLATTNKGRVARIDPSTGPGLCKKNGSFSIRTIHGFLLVSARTTSGSSRHPGSADSADAGSSRLAPGVRATCPYHATHISLRLQHLMLYF